MLERSATTAAIGELEILAVLRPPLDRWLRLRLIGEDVELGP